MNRAPALAAALTLLCLSAPAQAITIDTTRVGNPGNAGETRVDFDGISGRGSVSYTYNIGKYEVTAGQYTAFLNAVAKTDSYGLYNNSMSMWIGDDRYGCKIQQSGTDGNYNYSVSEDMANRPVNYVSFWDACRFANWLNNGQPTGLQDASTTERGVYTLDGYTGKYGTMVRNSGWKWAIASDNEWYKAAYYDPNKGGSGIGGYWLYPTRSNTAPGHDMADPNGNNANYYTYPITWPLDSGKYYTTVAGEFQNSASAYGTFDQAGNVWELNDTIFHREWDDEVCRGMRGGDFGDADYGYVLQASHYILNGEVQENYWTGFRVVQSVPEPSSVISLIGGLISFVGICRRKTHTQF